MQTILPEKTETQLLSPNNQLFHAEMATMDCTLPYLGYSHEGYVLLTQLCRRTRIETQKQFRAYCYAMKDHMREFSLRDITDTTALHLFKLQTTIGTK